jgi:hypothetical protein
MRVGVAARTVVIPVLVWRRCEPTSAYIPGVLPLGMQLCLFLASWSLRQRSDLVGERTDARNLRSMRIHGDLLSAAGEPPRTASQAEKHRSEAGAA